MCPKSHEVFANTHMKAEKGSHNRNESYFGVSQHRQGLVCMHAKADKRFTQTEGNLCRHVDGMYRTPTCLHASSMLVIKTIKNRIRTLRAWTHRANSVWIERFGFSLNIPVVKMEKQIDKSTLR